MIESEGHRNQTLTSGAASRGPAGKSPKAKRKVVALQLDEREQEALRRLGGVTALKKLLCPPGTCLACRERASVVGTHLDSLCDQCAE